MAISPRTPGASPLRPQFGLRSLLAGVTAVAVLFAIFRWLELTPAVSLLIAGLVIASLCGAIALVLAIVRSIADDDAA